MSHFLRATVLALASAVLYGQQLPFPTYLNPSMLYVRSSGATLSIFNQDYPAGLTALWNGSPRVTSQNSIEGSYSVTITAADLAGPQLAQIAMLETRSGAIIDTVNCPVGYNVMPNGVALDRSRNRLYIATPLQPADPQFPGSSVVTLNLADGTVGSVLQIGSALGDLALSDDGSALYVVVEGNNVVRRIDPSTMTAVGDFFFRPAGTKAAGGDLITVMPGKPDTVALGSVPDPGNSGTQIALYDNGVQRPNTIVNNGAFSSMLFSPDDNYLFQNGTVGYSVSPSDGGYQQVTFRYTVDSTGIQTQNPLFATGGAAAAIAGNTLYTSLADTIDYTTMTVTGNFGIEGPIAVDAVNQRAFILNGGGLQESGAAPPQLIAFAVPSLEALGSQTVGITSISTLNGSEQLIRFGADGFVIPSASGLLIFHTPLAEPAPSITAGAVLNAANFQPGPIAPGEILSIFGNNLGPPTPQTAGVTGGAFPFSLSNVQVWFGRLPATMLFADQGQINVVAPFELQPGAQVNLQVWYFGIPSAQIPLAVAPAAPALFSRDGSGTGPVAAINQDGSIDTPSPAGSVVSLWGTGGGLDPDAIDGELARGADNLSAPVHVSIGGSDAQVIYAGAAPGLVYGAFQLNVQIPADVPSGQAPITVTIDGVDSPKGATLEIR